MMIMYDFCAGTKSASRVMAERGWQVTTLDYDARFNPDVVADIRQYHYTGPRVDLMWFSPPCDDFAREFMPWSRTGNPPDMSIYQACKRIIAESNPRFWIIENVRGAVKYFGPARVNYGPFFLWGNFPDLGRVDIVYRNKESMSSTAHAQRAMIPAALSLAVARTLEQAHYLIEVYQ